MRTGPKGVLLCQGTSAGGYTFYVKDGRLHCAHNYVARTIFRVDSDTPVAGGHHDLCFEFKPTGDPYISRGRGTPGRLQLYIDGSLVGQA